MKQLLIWVLVLLVKGSSFGQADIASANNRADAFVSEKMGQLKIPGMAIAVVKSGKIVKLSTYGMANLEWNTKVSEHSNFQIASCTKLLTSTLLLKAIRDGRIRLEDHVGKYIDTIPVSWKPIQIKHLISHSSGLKDFKGDYYISTGTVVKALKDSTLEYAPGTGQHYAQADFMLLGYILERIYKKTLPALIQGEIAVPLNMNDGGYDMEQRTGSFMRTNLVKERATTYYDLEGSMQAYKFMYPQYYYSAGGYYASISDLANWAVGLDNETLIPRGLLEEHIYGKDSIGGKASQYTRAGWILENENGIRYAGHSGGPGLADILRFPGEGYTFIVLANDGELLPTFARAIASFYISGLPPRLNIEKFNR
ncbi:beta-lactamase family protein [Flavihumibacter rivuli]|uniref:serine hydrolase domain-containing protein n=1 Tax=Flavihumibacter rivuli TaxID=2838156 RepID=UPI001BDE1E22|nr:serine hydrolase domain-containing protein [Flavihumibacter rivuli]ULQ56064.1 beta-lactamase family protein [Flavihumibacter rivuli]